jgi:hypothetical protein
VSNFRVDVISLFLVFICGAVYGSRDLMLPSKGMKPSFKSLLVAPVLRTHFFHFWSLLFLGGGDVTPFSLFRRYVTSGGGGRGKYLQNTGICQNTGHHTPGFGSLNFVVISVNSPLDIGLLVAAVTVKWSYLSWVSPLIYFENFCFVWTRIDRGGSSNSTLKGLAC